MLVKGPISKEFAFVQQECYLRDQRHIMLMRVMEEMRSFPAIQNHGYLGATAEKVLGWQTTQTCNTHVPPVSSNPIKCMNPGYLSSAPRNNLSWESKRTTPNKNKREVSAFGPREAEHARRFYQSIGSKPDFRPGLASHYRPSFDPMANSNHPKWGVWERHCLPRANRPVHRATTCSDSADCQVYVPVKCQPKETVLKVARISPRPDMMQSKTLKTSFSFGSKLPIKKERLVKKSSEFHETGLEMDLKNAPLFQMLCEISKTKG